MPFEQKQLFCDEKQTSLRKEYNVKNEIADTIRSVPKPKILETSFHYEFKNVKISLPKIHIPNEVLMKHEVEKYRKLFQSKPQTARKSINIKTVSCAEECVLLCKSERAEEEGINMSAKVLNFSCSKCQDSTQYSPNDLQKHFQMWHHGELPSFPCEMCDFSANNFQIFKQHRQTHKSTLVNCDICNSKHRYTLLGLTRHFMSNHSVNGNFQCEECGFFTQDVGTIVQHIYRHKETHYKCGKCHHLCSTKVELQKHLHVHSGTLPFNCQYCSYGAIHKDQLVRHVITLHKEHLYAKEKLEKDNYDKRVAKTSGLKLILKRYKIGPSKTFWKRKKITNGSDTSIEKNTQVLNSVKNTQTKSEDQSHLGQEHLHEEKGERLHCEISDKSRESGKSTLLSTGQYNRADEGSVPTSGSLKSAVLPGTTVLLVKNNMITIPANYSAKFMGFKMVDGKQHIVIKLLPANKQNLSSPASQPDAAMDNTANLQPQTSDTTGFLPGVTTEVSDTVYMKAAPFSCSSTLSGKVISGKKKALIPERNNMLQTVDHSKSLSSLPTVSESVIASANTTEVEARVNVNLRENYATQRHPEVLGITIKSPDKVNLTTKPNAYNHSNMHNYCMNYVNSELPVDSSYHDESTSHIESSNQVGSLPFHNYSVNSKRHRFSKIAVCENFQRESSSKIGVQQPGNDAVLSLVRKESSNSDGLLASGNPLNDDGSLKMKAETKEQCVREEKQTIGGRNLCINENQSLECVAEESKWDGVSNTGSPMMPRITSVFSLQSKQASEFLPPEVNQLLQDLLKPKSDLKEDSRNIPNKNLSLNYGQSFQKAEEESMIESSKDSKVQSIFPVVSGSVGANVPTSDLNLKYNGREKQGLPISQDVRESEMTSKIPDVVTLLKTQSDAIITQQLVKDKLRTTTQSSGSIYIQSPLVTPEQKNPVYVQTPRSVFIPLHVANKSGFHVFSGQTLPFVNTQGVPTSLLVNKKPGMILTFNNGKAEGVSTVKTENAHTYGSMSKEPCKTPFLKVEHNSNCLTPAVCSSIGSCLSMKSNLENMLPLKNPYVIKTLASSSVKTVPFPNVSSEQQGSKMSILDSGKQNENFPKPSLYTILPDGKQAVFLKCVMPNNTELLKPKLVQNTTYQNIQPKITEGTPQKIVLKIVNPILSVTAAANLPVSNSASLQNENVPSDETTLGEQEEPESSRDALPYVSDDVTPANEVVLTSAATCQESSEQPVCISDQPEAIVLRCETNCSAEESVNRKKTNINKYSKIKTRIASMDAETGFLSRNRSCKRKCSDTYQEPPRKKSTSRRKCKEKAKAEDVQETLGLCRPRLSKSSVRTLRLFPFSSRQLVKCPRRNQPVVVLNHPDADSPEVENVMKTIAKFNGNVLKVALSKRTISALLKPVHYNTSETTYNIISKRYKTIQPVNSVKERFVLKLTLKKTSKNNYQIVKTTSEDVLKAKFNCWFCGRVFDNQDAWAGHGQRHLVESTRDWNMLL